MKKHIHGCSFPSPSWKHTKILVEFDTQLIAGFSWKSDDLVLGTWVWWSCTWNMSLMILHLEHESDDLGLGTWVWWVESLCCDSLQSLESSTLQSSYLWPALQSLQLRCKHLDSCHSWSWRALIISLWQLQSLAPSWNMYSSQSCYLFVTNFLNAPGIARDFQQGCKKFAKTVYNFPLWSLQGTLQIFTLFRVLIIYDQSRFAPGWILQEISNWRKIRNSSPTFFRE
jgi:hypothetical protein